MKTADVHGFSHQNPPRIHEFPHFPLQWIKITLLLEVVDLLEYGKKHPGFRIQIDRFSQKKKHVLTPDSMSYRSIDLYFF